MFTLIILYFTNFILYDLTNCYKFVFYSSSEFYLCLNMSKLSINEDELENSEQPHGSTWEKPNLKGDRVNIFVLIILYTLQGITYGLTISLLLIFQNKKMVTYTDLVSDNVNL